jgi:hypothetical protein
MNKYDKKTQKEWVKSFSKWEESKAIGKYEMFLALFSSCALGFLLGFFS